MFNEPFPIHAFKRSLDNVMMTKDTCEKRFPRKGAYYINSQNIPMRVADQVMTDNSKVPHNYTVVCRYRSKKSLAVGN